MLVFGFYWSLWCLIACQQSTLNSVGVTYRVMSGLASSSSSSICRGALSVCYVNTACVCLSSRSTFGFAFDWESDDICSCVAHFLWIPVWNSSLVEWSWQKNYTTGLAGFSLLYIPLALWVFRTWTGRQSPLPLLSPGDAFKGNAIKKHL